MTFQLPILKTIFWFHHTGCGFCRQAEPVLDAWKMKHSDVIVVKLNCAHTDWEKFGYRPRRTPAYLYVEGRNPIRSIEGALLKERDIDRFIEGKLES